jgi:hypothetical protein
MGVSAGLPAQRDDSCAELTIHRRLAVRDGNEEAAGGESA